MNSVLRTCGLAALTVGVTCLAWGTAEAGGRRYYGCQQYQSNYYYTAPVTTTYGAPATAATTDGRQRYQSAYQAPTYATVNDGYYSNNGYYSAPPNNYLYGSGHYGGGIPLQFQDRTFHDQWDAGRKIRGY